MTYEPCDYRYSVGEFQFCSHQQKHIALQIATEKICKDCTTRFMPCDNPRPVPTESDLLVKIETNKSGQPIPKSPPILAPFITCKHRLQVNRRVKAKGCSSCGQGVEIYGCEIHGECNEVIEHPALPKHVCGFRNGKSLCPQYELPDNRKPRPKRQPWQPPTGIPKLGILKGFMQLGGVGRAFVELSRSLTRLEVSGVAIRSDTKLFQPFVDGFGCPVYSGEIKNWQHNAQKVIDSSTVLLVWGLTGQDAFKGLNFRGLPIISYSQNTPQDSWCCWELATASKIATHYLSCSEASIASYPEQLRSKVKVVINGVSPATVLPKRSREEVRDALGISHESIVLGYLGRVSKHKHPSDVAKAAASLGNPYLGLIVGNGDWEKECLAECDGLPVVFSPPTDHVADFLNAIDVFINTSDYEGSSLALTEAWLAGVPVVSTPTGSIPELEISVGTCLVSRVGFGASPQEIALAVKDALLRRLH